MAVITMSKTLHVIHPQFDFSTVNNSSILLDSITADLSNNNYHTSLGDMSSRDIISMISKFDNINFCNNLFNESDSLFAETVALLTYIQNFKPVSNFHTIGPTTFADATDLHSRPDTPVLWVFGCSHSHGVGLRDGESKYGEILAQEMNLPLKLITKPGSSLHWSLRQLMSADIRHNDIVVWQITTPGRVSVFNGKHVKEIVLARTNDRHLLEVYTSEQIYFNHLTLLLFGVQYLRAKQINFRLTTFEDRPEEMFTTEYRKYPEYCYAPGFNVDIGSDGLHYGPLSHKALAFALLDHIQCKNVYTI